MSTSTSASTSPAITRRAALALAGSSVLALAACGGAGNANPGKEADVDTAGADSASATTQLAALAAADRITLYSWAHPTAEPQITPAVASQRIDSSLSNVTVAESFNLGDDARAALGTRGFFVDEANYDEFFEPYEKNRYTYRPNLVTVDSMMHSYHLYFQCLLKGLERGALSQSLTTLASLMLDVSQAQAAQLAGTPWESAVTRNVTFFAVADALVNPSAQTPAEVADAVAAELTAIEQAAGTQQSPTTGLDVDYSQFAPRGYYASDETLERYFRAMMWYGQLSFLARDEDLTRSAFLITFGLEGEAQELWQSVYAVTSFFAGASDDNSCWDYRAALIEVLGEGATLDALTSDDEAWSRLWQLASQMPAPKINSIPGSSAADAATDTGFRFMGQRFSIDAYIFQQLVADNIGINAAGEPRLLPDALDIPAAFGSAEALAILEEQGDTAYEGYSETMGALKDGLAQATDQFWQASLYNQWLHTLLPLLDAKGDGYPDFMLSREWTRHDLESFLGSYTELKHDTVLYGKQPVAEGDGDIPEEADDRGYVQPEPFVFVRLRNLCEATASGLDALGMLDATQAEDLTILQTLATDLATIAAKELAGEMPTADEFELIRSIGVQLEHFWKQAKAEEIEAGGYSSPMQLPAPVVADVATGGSDCLELGTTFVHELYAVVPVEGDLRVASGPVFGFRQFVQPSADRLTDGAWLDMLRLSWRDPTEATQAEAWAEGYLARHY